VPAVSASDNQLTQAIIKRSEI
jgi:hypothetical protein